MAVHLEHIHPSSRYQDVAVTTEQSVLCFSVSTILSVLFQDNRLTIKNKLAVTHLLIITRTLLNHAAN